MKTKIAGRNLNLTVKTGTKCEDCGGELLAHEECCVNNDGAFKYYVCEDCRRYQRILLVSKNTLKDENDESEKRDEPVIAQIITEDEKAEEEIE